MKKLSLILLGVVAMASSAYAQRQKKSFVLNGKMTDKNISQLVFSYEDASGEKTIDTVHLKNGSFTLKGNIDMAAIGYVSAGEKEENYRTIVLMPGTMQLAGNGRNLSTVKITGSRLDNEYGEIEKAREKIMEKYQVVLDSLRDEKDHDKAGAIRERLAPFFEECNQADYRYFDSHPQSILTAYQLRFHTADLSLDSMQHYYDKLGTTAQQTVFGKMIGDELYQLRNGSPGATAANFSVPDINGKTLSLSDYKGHYVLLDFWASWCVPCRQGNPHLKELYAKYQPKGWEIIGVSDDDRDNKAWKTAVAKDDLPWKHVLRGMDRQNPKSVRDISAKYGIHSLPTKILIDPKGVIIGRYGSEGDELDKKLKEVYSE